MNLLRLIVPLMLAGAQDSAEPRSVTISKQERSAYIPALEKHREAEAALRKDAQDCILRCTELIDDKSLKDACREARVRVQNTDGSYGEWLLLIPFQLRGRALLAQAQGSAGRDRKEAGDLVRKAVADLDESVRRGMKSSAPYLDQARELAASLKDAAPTSDPRAVEAQTRMKELQLLVEQRKSPAAILKRCDELASTLKGTPYEGEWRYVRTNALGSRWAEDADAGRFRSALAVVAGEGKFLTEDERSSIRAEIEKRCSLRVESEINRFKSEVRETLPPEQAWSTLARLAQAEFDRRFALPDGAELVGPPPGLEWGRSCRERLRNVRSIAEAPNGPLAEFRRALSEASQAAVDAAPLLREGENRAFAALEGLAYDLAQLRLKRIVEGARADPPEGLRIRREEAKTVVGDFEDFGARLDKALSSWPDRGASFRRHHPFLAVHLEQVRVVASRLPVDLDRIDQIAKALFDPANPNGLWGKTGRLALDYETELLKLEQSEAPRLSRNCRRKLDTCLLVAVISRLLLSGERGEEICRREDLQKIGRRLGEVGGPESEMLNLVSPKIRSLAARLNP